MTIALADFLAAHPPDTDMRLVEWRSEGEDRLQCVLETSPWWLAAEHRKNAAGRLVIDMSGIVASNVRLGWRAEEVEDLEVLRDHPLLWPHGTHASIYGNAPLPDPRRFFTEFWDLLHFELGAGEAVPMPFEFTSYQAWSKRVTEHHTYLLLEGPAPVMAAAQRLLDAQGAVYRLLLGPERRTDGLQVLCIGESYVVCSEAVVSRLSPDYRNANEPFGDASASFARMAGEFRALIDRHHTLERDVFLHAVHARLAPLYAAALALPEVEVLDGDEIGGAPEFVDVDEDRLGYDEWSGLYRSLGAHIGERDYYSEVFDAYAEPPKEPVIGSLADDLADIYQDLADGLDKWRRGEADGAVWTWRFSFTTHWGNHATSALRALHVLAAHHELGFRAPGADL